MIAAAEAPASTAGTEQTGTEQTTAEPTTAEQGPAEPALAAIADIEQQFAAMYQRVKAGMRDRANRLHPGLSPLGFHLVRMLAHQGPMHAGRLAEALDIDKSIVSRQAAQLVGLGLLERTRDTTDGRAVYLDLTPEAHERIARIRTDDARMLREGLSSWSTPDLRTLADLFERMNDSLV